MEYTTYLFDFDYTLADSSRGIVICFRNVLGRHGHTDITDEQIKRTIGKTLEDSFSILTGITDTGILAAYKKEYIKEADTYMNANTFLFPETVSVLNALKKQGAKLGVVSTKFRYRLKGVLDLHFPADFFDIIVGGEDVKVMKPDPQGILGALKKLGRNRKETLYIGDSTVDAETAQNAKVDFVGVLNGMTTREELAAYPHRRILNDLSLLPLVQRPSVYKPSRYVPGKLEAVWRMVQIKLMRGKQIDKRSLPQEQVCKNCGQVYLGSYCPTCGQTCDTPRFTLRNAFKNILSGFFNIDNGFSRNLLEFLCRPGYMMRNYVDGQRVHYFKPFQTLFVLAALYVMMVQLVDPAAMREAEQEKPEYTYESLDENLRTLREETLQKSVRRLLGQSAHYADSARILEERHDSIVSEKLQLDRKMAVELGILLADRLEAAGENPNVRTVIRELSDSLVREDSLRLIDADEATRTIIQEKAKQRKRIFREMRSESNFGKAVERFTTDAEKADTAWQPFKEKWLDDDGFLMSVFHLMESWIHGNKAFSILALLPIFTFGVRWGFRRTPVGRRLNLTEVFFAQVYVACQILWLSILMLPFTGEAHLDDVFDLNYFVVFFLFVWDFRQLFGVSWWYSFRRTIVSGCYCLLLILAISILLVVLALLLAFFISGENPLV